MSAMTLTLPTFPRSLLACALACLLTTGCSSLRPAATPATAFYSLDTNRGVPAVTPPVQPEPVAGRPTLIINPPHAAAGYDSQRIIYVRKDHKLEYFAHSEWVDPPARMLAPLLVAAFSRTSAFEAVALTPSAAAADLRLDTELIRLEHDFAVQPSRVRFTLRAYLIDDKTRRIVTSREFDATVPSESENPYGGVVAANRAVRTALDELAAYCAQAVRTRIFTHPQK